MSMRLRSSTWMRLALVVAVLAGSVTLLSSTKSPFTERDKAYYADEATVNFVRPGLIIKVEGVDIAADNTVRVRFRLTDPRGLPLDRLGVTTPGTINTSFILAALPKEGASPQYVAYTTRTQGPTPSTSPVVGARAVQAAADNPAGTYRVISEGLYEYTMTTKFPANADRTATHTVGVYGSRNLSEFNLPTNYDDDVYNFIPAGGTVTQTRELIKTETCNKCHDPLALHGGSRRSMELCNLCHTPQTIDPDTGEPQDMKVLIHKIHYGAGLPSVRAGKPYVIIGNAQSVHDYSGIVIPSDARNCAFCHEPGAKQADNWLTKPSRAACGSCHDNVNFATGENHLNLPQPTDNQCANCHKPEGELDFDASIKGAHTIPRFSREIPGTVFEIVSVTGAAGQKPVVVYNIKTKKGDVIKPADFTRLALVLAGPTEDYTWAPRGYVSEDPRAASVPDGNNWRYTFTASLPANAKGTWAVGIEGYNNVTLLPGTTQQMTQRDAGVNVVKYFSVDGSAVKPRREVVSLAKCNDCHSNLSLHGDNRNRIEQCVLCHNPVETDAAVRPAAQMPAQGIDMRTMIHRIHTGHELEYDYVVYGRGSVAYNFNHVGYPGDRRNCQACHINNSEQLPLRETNSWVKDPRGYLDPVGPEAAACLSCHTSKAAASHALANTTSLGESCAACHGPNAEFSINRVHAR